MEPRRHRDSNPEREALLQELEELLASRLGKPERDDELEAKIAAIAAKLG